MLVVSEYEVRSSRPSPVERLRNALDQAVRGLYGARGGSAQALVLNRWEGITPELRDRYARAGLIHILSISGFHVGVILGWVVLCGRAAGLPPRRATLLALGVVFAYVLFLGWPPPAARAALLAGLSALFHLRQRKPQAISLLAVTGLVLLMLDPWAVLSPGAWMSLAALSGTLVATRWSDRALGRGWVQRLSAASVGATIATAPITAFLFGMVSLSGIVLNFVAIPIAALAVPGLLLSLIIGLVSPGAAAPLAAGVGALLGLLDQVAWWGGALDWPVIVTQAGWAAAIPWVVVLGLAAFAIGGGTTRWEAARRVALGVAALVWVFAGVEQYQAIHDAEHGLTLHFLDVGQGDAAVLRTPQGRWILIDAGPRTEQLDAGRRVVVPFLARHRANGLSVAVVTHAHADHLGGAGAVLERYHAGRVLEPAELVGDSLYTGFLDQLDAEGVPWLPARDGLHFEIDSVRFTVLHPDTAWAEWRLDLNEDSVVLLVEYGGFRALFPGDAGLHAEQRLAGRVGHVDVLKVGHHGSRSASGEAWLDELGPRIAIISAGTGNRYGHPHGEVLERLARHGVTVWRTDEDGTVTVTTDGHRMTVEGGHRAGTFELDGE